MRENGLHVRVLLACALAAAFVGFAARRPAPRAVTEDYDWRDGKALALEGRGFPQSTLYSRLPEKWKGVVPDVEVALDGDLVPVDPDPVSDNQLSRAIEVLEGEIAETERDAA